MRLDQPANQALWLPGGPDANPENVKTQGLIIVAPVGAMFGCKQTLRAWSPSSVYFQHRSVLLKILESEVKMVRFMTRG